MNEANQHLIVTIVNEGYAEKEFDVPGIGVEEFNVLLEGTVSDYSLTDPSGFTYTGDELKAITMTGQGFAVIKVEDTGCGMTPEVGAHIFEKFYQGDTSHATRGNGLGLALVKRVIDIMQGRIAVESAVGKGTTFTVTIRRV